MLHGDKFQDLSLLLVSSSSSLSSVEGGWKANTAKGTVFFVSKVDLARRNGRYYFSGKRSTYVRGRASSRGPRRSGWFYWSTLKGLSTRLCVFVHKQPHSPTQDDQLRKKTRPVSRANIHTVLVSAAPVVLEGNGRRRRKVIP